MVALPGMVKTLQYALRSQPYPLEKPIIIQLPLGDIGQADLQACGIKENSPSDDITPDLLRQGLRNPLYSEVRSVGLDCGEPTSRKDLGDLTQVLFDELPKLQTIALITSAYRYPEAIDRISDIGMIVRQHGGRLDVMLSMDGDADAHEAVPDHPTDFLPAKRVIDFCRQSSLVDAVRIGCTVIRENVYGLHDLLDFCQRENLPVKYCLSAPHKRRHTEHSQDPSALTFEERYHFTEFLEGLIQHYETSEHQRNFYRSLIGQIMHSRSRAAGCDWQHRGATITAKGELLYCAIQSKSLGRIHEVDSEEAFFANAGHLRDIYKTKCPDCHHDYVGLPDRREQLRMLGLKVMRKMNVEQPLRALLTQPAIARFRGARRLHRQRAALMQKVGALGVADRTIDRIGPIKVMVCGWYGTETLGDKAILAGIAVALRASLGPVALTVVSLNEYITRMTRAQMSELADMTIIDVAAALLKAGEQDLVVFGGGPIMAIRELAEMEAIFAAAKRSNVPTLLAGCGVGPIGSPAFQRQIGRIVSLADARIYRDQKSLAAAKALGIDVSTDHVAEDPAFTWLASLPASGKTRAAENGQVLLLGLRDFPWHDYAQHLSPADGKAIAHRFEATILKALSILAADHPDLTIRPLPMCTNHFGGDDRFFYRELFLNVPDALRERLDYSLLDRELPPLDYVAAFNNADAMITMRFHSLVFAIGTQLPAVAIDYTLSGGKVTSLADRFGIANQPIDLLDADFLVKEVSDRLASPKAPATTPSFSVELGKCLSALGFAITTQIECADEAVDQK